MGVLKHLMLKFSFLGSKPASYPTGQEAGRQDLVLFSEGKSSDFEVLVGLDFSPIRCIVAGCVLRANLSPYFRIYRLIGQLV